MYSPVAGSSRCEPARWHSPSRSATRPPSEPTFDDASVSSGSSRAQRRGGEVEDEVVRADRDDRAVDLVEAAQQLDLDLLARVVALEPGRHDQQAVGADERGQHAGAARQRRGHDLAADPPEPDPDPVVRAERGGQLAGQPGGGRRALARGGALERGQQRRGEDVEGQRGRDRVAGGAEHRGAASTDAEHDRVPGPHRDAVHGERAALATTRAV